MPYSTAVLEKIEWKWHPSRELEEVRRHKSGGDEWADDPHWTVPADQSVCTVRRIGPFSSNWTVSGTSLRGGVFNLLHGCLRVGLAGPAQRTAATSSRSLSMSAGIGPNSEFCSS